MVKGLFVLFTPSREASYAQSELPADNHANRSLAALVTHNQSFRTF